jgi:large subunit ribosomal protein L17
LAQSLFEHGRITTTLPKAKDVRSFCEKLITLAVRVRRATAQNDRAAALSARRRIHRLLGDRCVIPAEHQADYDGMSDAARAKTLRMPSGRRHRTGEPRGRLAFTADSVTHRLVETLAPRFQDRPGGYTRIIRLARPRIGDSAPRAVLQLVGEETPPGALAKPEPSARQRRANARYALAISAMKGRGKARRDRPSATDDDKASANAPIDKPQESEENGGAES